MNLFAVPPEPADFFQSFDFLSAREILTRQFGSLWILPMDSRLMPLSRVRVDLDQTQSIHIPIRCARLHSFSGSLAKAWR